MKTILVEEHKKVNTKPNTPNFDELILETVDSTFSALEDSCKQAIYYHLENSHGLKREVIPGNVTTFARDLEEIFWQAAFALGRKN
jgi:hypothetical protein